MTVEELCEECGDDMHGDQHYDERQNIWVCPDCCDFCNKHTEYGTWGTDDYTGETK